MKIAVTYDNGEIFQHFGHTEQFKLYDIENGKVVASEVVGTNGSGHGALAGFLAEHQVQVLIPAESKSGGYTDLRRYRRRSSECPGSGRYQVVWRMQRQCRSGR